VEGKENEYVFLEAVPRLPNGTSLLEASSLSLGNLHTFRAPSTAMEQARLALAQAGTQVIIDNGLTISLMIDVGLLKHLCNDDRAATQSISGELSSSKGTDFMIPNKLHSGLFECVAGFAKMPANQLNSLSLPPQAPYFHLRAPQDLRTSLNAERALNNGFNGHGTQIAVVDSGCNVKHSFFTQSGTKIRVMLGPTMSDPQTDQLGHGTLVCGNIVSIAPRANITVIKTYDAASLVGFKQASLMVPQPDVIQNTWGHDVMETALTAYDRVVIAAILDAIERGILVVFAAGNGKVLFPPQMPEVMSVGGVFLTESGELIASAYASGYRSVLFPNRIVPDFCGMVGMQPGGVYIMLPTEPGSEIDRYFATRPFPQGDGLSPDDGWVVASGTSSASAQVSGVCAILRQIAPGIRQEEVKKLLCRTATPINMGASAQGNPSGPPYPNLATGYGLISLQEAMDALNASRLAGVEGR
jgi:subtilisin family serine protease